jgi:8-amino-3,8-dideoxy-alpha-D-manno-octulosonate transaminase
LKSYLQQVPEITFRATPDKDGDSCSFVSWFLPTETLTKAVVEELKAQGILAGNFYWYNNNWHYISKWDHLKNAITLNGQSAEVTAKLKSYATKSFPASDAIMSRCISTAISLAWTEEQIKEKGEKLLSVINKVLAKQVAAV